MKHKHYRAPQGSEADKLHAARRRAALTAAGCATYTLGQRGGRAGIVCLCCGLGSSHPDDLAQKYCGFCAAFHTGWNADPQPAVDRQMYTQEGIVNILVQSGYGHNTRKPFVEMVLHAADFSTQTPPAQARELAFNLLGCAEAANSDGFLMGFMQNLIGVKERAALAGVLGQFREYREKQQGGDHDS